MVEEAFVIVPGNEADGAQAFQLLPKAAAQATLWIGLLGRWILIPPRIVIRKEPCRAVEFEEEYGHLRNQLPLTNFMKF